MTNRNSGIFNRSQLLLSVGTIALMSAALAPSASAIVPNDDQTSEEIVDEEGGVNGVGMFFRSDGFVCTGTLINPRTVLFAAHCVNNAPETAYGTSIRSAFSFNVNALPGFQNWITNNFTSNPDLLVYDISQIQYNPDSLANPQAIGFLEADIALATLDIPAVNIPTWALLFSPLPTPDALDPVTGTGYHVNITGYGRSGSGTTGASVGIDFRRRAAENMLGALVSQNKRDEFLFGVAFSDLPQNLYRLDFDDPNKTSPFDFNLYLDEPLEREGTTAGGDSGGPLILDAANNPITDENIQIGVLSGGSRFFGPQVFSSYGTSSFYQPLYLFYDYIAEVNPYRYVGAEAGDGNWEDGDHWISLLDPNYRIIDANGNIVNGFPDEAADGLNGTEPAFGGICFDPEGNSPFDECENLENGDPVPPARNTAPGEAPDAEGVGTVSNIGRVSVDDLGVSNGLGGATVSIGGGAEMPGGTTAAIAASGGVNFAENQPQAAGPLPAPTIANGLPGATGFVPDNTDPDVANNVRGRYFDVTLSAAGTTTLSSTVEIDKLTLAGAGLNIATGGALTSNIDVTQFMGVMNVDGSLTTPGDYLLMTGLLSGNGTINTPFLTNVAGGIAPGGIGTAGELTIDGGLVLSSGSTLLYDITASGSDLLTVTGDVSLGGTVAAGFAGVTPTFGETYNVLTYGGTASGAFSSATGFGPGVLRGNLSQEGNSVLLSVDALKFTDFLPAGASDLQLSYARALDQARGNNYADLAGLFSKIDVLAPGDVGTAFEMISPNDSIVAGQASLAMSDALGGRVAARLRDLRRGESGFVTSAPVNAIEVAAADGRTGFAAAAGQLAASGTEGESQTYDMKSGFGGFLNVDFFTGEAETAFLNRDADIEGLVVTGGLDKTFDSGTVIGAFASYGTSENDLSGGLGGVDSDGGSVGLYTYVPRASGVYFDGYASYGSYSYDTGRNVTIPGGAAFTANGSVDSDQIMAGASIGKVFATPDNKARFTPSVGIDHLSVDFDRSTETGGPIALDISSRNITSTQLSAGAEADFSVGDSGAVRLNTGGFAIYDLSDDDDSIIATFAAAPTLSAITLAGPKRESLWFEVQAGIDVDFSSRVVGSLGVKQSLGRDTLEQTTFGGSLVVKF